MVTLRDYQASALEAIKKAETAGVQRQLVVQPTGSGKTVLFAHLIADRPNRSLVLVHRDELVGQTIAKLGLIAPGLTTGVVKAERNELDRDVVVASVQTATRQRRLEQLQGFGTVVVDEAHHAVAPSWKKVLTHLGCFEGFPGGPLTVGFTATPQRDNGGIGGVWQDVVAYKSIRELIYAGYLSPVVGQTVDTEADFSGVRVSRGDFDEAELGEELASSGAIEQIAAAYAKYAPLRKGVAFTPTVATAHRLADALKEHGISAEPVWGAMPPEQRKAALRRLRTGETQVITNCAVLTEGFDEPSVDCIVVARPTKSHGLYIQMVGRGTRLHPGKTDCLVLDVVGATERHDLVALVDLGLDRSAKRKPSEAGTEQEAPPGECTLCGRPLSADLVTEGARRHPNCRAGKTGQADVFAASKLRWLPVDDGFCLPADKGVLVMRPAPGPDELWQLANYESGKLEVLHASLPVEWAQGIGEDRAKAFGKLSRRDARWLDQEPTSAQISRLIREGLPRSRAIRIKTRGQAADLLTRIQGRRAIRKLVAAR